MAPALCVQAVSRLTVTVGVCFPPILSSEHVFLCTTRCGSRGQARGGYFHFFAPPSSAVSTPPVHYLVNNESDENYSSSETCFFSIASSNRQIPVGVQRCRQSNSRPRLPVGLLTYQLIQSETNGEVKVCEKASTLESSVFGVHLAPSTTIAQHAYLSGTSYPERPPVPDRGRGTRIEQIDWWWPMNSGIAHLRDISRGRSFPPATFLATRPCTALREYSPMLHGAALPFTPQTPSFFLMRWGQHSPPWSQFENLHTDSPPSTQVVGQQVSPLSFSFRTPLNSAQTASFASGWYGG